MIGWPGQPPAIPMNIIADFAGGGLHAAFGILAALMARERTGKRPVRRYRDVGRRAVRCSRASSGGVLMGGESPSRGATLLNGSVPHYNVYECSDGGWITIGSLEPHFFVNLCKTLGCEQFIPHQYDASKRDEITAYFTQAHSQRSRATSGSRSSSETDICAGPVYSLRGGARRPAQPRARHGRRSRAPDARQDPAPRHRHEALRHARLGAHDAPLRRPAHRRRARVDVGTTRPAIAALRERGIVG